MDGLRAIAVLAVVGFHAFPGWIRGGFVGVDIFFVISGFLISRIILEHLALGRFSFLHFYGRRVRRIFPALLLVLIASYSFGWIALTADEYKQLGKHIAGGAAFVSNLVSWRESGYFDGVAEAKPLLHLWSLSIEEQFYLAWPAMLWCAWKLRVNTFAIIVSVCVVSFTLGVRSVGHDARAAFYLPQMRFWELLIGAVLAHRQLQSAHPDGAFQQAPARFPPAHPVVRLPAPRSQGRLDAMALSGAALIALSIFVISKERQFPGWWAVLPTAGSVLVLAAGSKAWFNHAVLSNRVLVWFGLISYPLYLWHWPLLSFARIVEGEKPAPGTRLAAVAIAVALSALTYKWIETPARTGKRSAAIAIVLVVLVFAGGGVGYGTFRRGGVPRRTANQMVLDREQLTWPDEKAPTARCQARFPLSRWCVLLDDDEPTVAIVGDSHANQLFYGLHDEYRRLNETLVQLGDGACPPLLGITSAFRGGEDSCHSSGDYALRTVAGMPAVHTVILAANWHLYLVGSRYGADYRDDPPREIRSLSDPALQTNLVVFEVALRRTVALLKAAGKRIVIIKQAPELDFPPADCIGRRRFQPGRATRTVEECVLDRRDIQAYLAEYEVPFDRVVRTIVGVDVWDPVPLFCGAQECLIMHGGKLLYRDESHLTLHGSRFVASKLKLQ